MTKTEERIVTQALWSCYSATGADVSPDYGMAAPFWAHRAVDEVEALRSQHDAALSVLQDIYDAGLIKDDVLVAQAWAALNYETPAVSTKDAR